MEKHIIKLADGTELSAELNGNNYIVDGDVTAKLTAENIASATINGVTYTALILDVARIEDNKTWFIVHEQTQSEKDKVESKENMNVSLDGIGDLGQIVSDLTDYIAALGETISALDVRIGALEGKEVK